MPSDRPSDPSAQGHVEIRPNGQHRWVPAADPAPIDGTLSYAAPTSGPPRTRLREVLAVVIGFVVGVPGGFIGVGAAVNLIWGSRQWQANPCPFAAVALFAFIGAYLCITFKRAFFAGLLLGIGMGLLLACLMVGVMAGMHHA